MIFSGSDSGSGKKFPIPPDPQHCLAEEGVLVVLHVYVGVVEELDVHVAVEGAVHVPHHGFVLEAFAQGHHQLLGGHPVPT